MTESNKNLSTIVGESMFLRKVHFENIRMTSFEAYFCFVACIDKKRNRLQMIRSHLLIPDPKPLVLNDLKIRPDFGRFRADSNSTFKG